VSDWETLLGMRGSGAMRLQSHFGFVLKGPFKPWRRRSGGDFHCPASSSSVCRTHSSYIAPRWLVNLCNLISEIGHNVIERLSCDDDTVEPVRASSCPSRTVQYGRGVQ